MLLSLAYEGLPPDELVLVREALLAIEARATFFVNPPKVLDNLPIWQALADDGHEIANAALGGVSLSGELVNWTLRMLEQDLHMTQSFLDDLFAEHAVPVFAYPGPFTRCADGDYRSVVEEMFALSVSSGDFERPPSSRAARRIGISEWKGGELWSVVNGPRADTDDFDQLVLRTQERSAEIVPIYAAAQRLGIVPLTP